MCGKFRTINRYSLVEAFFFGELERNARAAQADDEVTMRVMNNVHMLAWNREAGERQILTARWGFPHPKDWRRPQPIHAWAETIETTRAFRDAFFNGQRGIVLVTNFNEAPETGEQHTVTPDTDKTGIAFLWREFPIEGVPRPLYACVMVTVSANKLIATLPTDRMPAVLDPKDWAKWIGEELAATDELKAMLKTVEGVNWKMTKEERQNKAKRQKVSVRQPTGM